MTVVTRVASRFRYDSMQLQYTGIIGRRTGFWRFVSCTHNEQYTGRTVDEPIVLRQGQENCWRRFARQSRGPSLRYGALPSSLSLLAIL
jgi:hypothetical protein